MLFVSGACANVIAPPRSSAAHAPVIFVASGLISYPSIPSLRH
jgi:hypothetical protein